MKVIIAAAGTGGHINPGIAIANKIKQEEKDSKIIFIGTNRGLENDLVPRAGYELKTIDAYGLSKKISIDNKPKFKFSLKFVVIIFPNLIVNNSRNIFIIIICKTSFLNNKSQLQEILFWIL